MNPDWQPAIYIITNRRNGTLYTGITTNLQLRVYQHRSKTVDGFSKKHSLNRLVYFELADDIHEAIQREKQIKAGSRKRKLQLIERDNPNWRDLYDEIF